jgi:hypothetical protein
MLTRRGFRTLATLGWVAVMVAGCGEGSTLADQYTGTWSYDDATSVVQCTGTEPLSEPPIKNKTLGQGIGANEIVDLSISPLERLRGVTCNFVFEVVGTTARVRPDQTCQLNAIDVLTIDPDPDAGGKPKWTFTLNSPTTAEEIVLSTIHIFQPSTTPGAPPTETTCAWSMTGHLTRITKD